jgi:hypothetical protein
LTHAKKVTEAMEEGSFFLFRKKLEEGGLLPTTQ